MDDRLRGNHVYVVSLTGCDSFTDVYAYQTPANQGAKHPNTCTFQRIVDAGSDSGPD